MTVIPFPHKAKAERDIINLQPSATDEVRNNMLAVSVGLSHLYTAVRVSPDAYRPEDIRTMTLQIGLMESIIRHYWNTTA